MPRRYYSKRTRVIRPRKKWASNLSQLVGAQTSNVAISPPGQAPNTHYIITSDLAQNKAQSGSPTPVILKCGNFKLKGDMRLYLTSNSTTAAQFAGCIAYIVYVPEGVQTIATIVQMHPEWIMAWSPINVDLQYVESGTPVTQNVEKFSMSSRLKRNLNSGDKVVMLLDLLFVPNATATTTSSISITYQPSIGVQYWTCAN